MIARISAGRDVSRSAFVFALDPCRMPMLQRLKKRRDFVHATRSGRKVVTPGLVLQMVANADIDGDVSSDKRAPRVGFTASRKVGNAVARNRAKRRLREVARLVLGHCGEAGMTYVLIARKATNQREFESLRQDLEGALEKLQRKKDARR